jgi:hypothetical protein
VHQIIYSFIFLFVGFGFISQAVAETWYVKKSKTKLQAETKARSKVLGKLNTETPVYVLGKSASYFKKHCYTPPSGLDIN